MKKYLQRRNKKDNFFCQRKKKLHKKEQKVDKNQQDVEKKSKNRNKKCFSKISRRISQNSLVLS